MSDLRTRIAAIQRAHVFCIVECSCGYDIDSIHPSSPDWKTDAEADWADHVAGAVIEALGADCIYRYACHRCGDFWFDTSERMQRFALLHGKAHADD